MFDMLTRAGFMAWPTLAFCVLALGVGLLGLVVASVAKSRGGAIALPAATVLLVALAGASGLAGYLWGLQEVEAALAAADPSARSMLEAVGRDEAAQNLYLAALGGALPFFLGVAGLALGATRKLER